MSDFRRRFRGSPLERTKLKRLRRNVAIAMGNSGDPRFLPQLETWAQEAGGDPSNSTAPQDPVLREAAEWARARILKPLDSKIISQD